MVSGHLTKKSGYWYIVLNLRKGDGIKKPKWFSTGLKVKGNKRKAEELLVEMRRQYSAFEFSDLDAHRLMFSDYLVIWLTSVKTQISPSTYESYHQIVHKKLIPYFEEIGTTLTALKPFHIEAFYQEQYEQHLSSNTVLRYHSIIHKALNDAARKELIILNPAALAKRPKKSKYVTIPYSTLELNQLFKAIRGHKLELLIILTAFYGLRRSEVLGLRWQAIDFNNNTLIINHTFQQVIENGTMRNIAKDKLKRDSSYRTLPIPDIIRTSLMEYRNERYAKELPSPETYLFLDKKGVVVKPDYVTNAFSKILRENGFRHIRFHDLRHSSAGVLIANRVPLIEVQQWLGHSTISTTADLYAHLDYVVKERSSFVMSQQLFEMEDKYDDV